MLINVPSFLMGLKGPEKCWQIGPFKKFLNSFLVSITGTDCELD